MSVASPKFNASVGPLQGEVFDEKSWPEDVMEGNRTVVGEDWTEKGGELRETEKLLIDNLEKLSVDQILLRIAQNESHESPLHRWGAFVACRYLIVKREVGVGKLCLRISTLKLQDQSLTIRKEGFRYLSLVSKQEDLPNSREFLKALMEVAGLFLLEHGDDFGKYLFHLFLKECEDDDAEWMSEELLNLFARGKHKVRSLSYIVSESLNFTLRRMTVEKMCSHPSSEMRDDGFGLYWFLLKQEPKLTLPFLVSSLKEAFCQGRVCYHASQRVMELLNPEEHLDLYPDVQRAVMESQDVRSFLLQRKSPCKKEV